ncbi:MAG: hypothetical protein ACHQ1D_01265 [Nitrososphaerales archaeon]
MKNVSVQLRQSFYEIEEAVNDLSQLYDHMVYSSGAVEGDLRGLNTAIEVLSKISRQMEREIADGF